MDPVIVVTRHPDADDDVRVFGIADAHVVVLDLGASFDGRPTDEETAADWADGAFAQISGLPLDHPARLAVVEVIRETCGDVLDFNRLLRIAVNAGGVHGA